MPQTVLTSSTSYCTAAQFLVRYDWRSVADFLSDTAERLSEAATLASTKLAALLKQASGKVETACLIGERYTPTDLAALTGCQAELLQGLVADLTIAMIMRRRPDTVSQLPPQAEEADNILNALASGQRIFGFEEAADAGHLDHEIETKAQVENRHLPTYTAGRLFGTRNNRIG